MQSDRDCGVELQGSRAVCVKLQLCNVQLCKLCLEKGVRSLQETGEAGWVAKPDVIRSELLLCRVSAVLADFPHSCTHCATLEFALRVVGPVVGKGGSFHHSALALSIFTCCVCAQVCL